MKNIIFIVILISPFIANCQPQFVDVGEKVVKVSIYRDRYGFSNLAEVPKLVAAINSATDAGLLKWEKLTKDSIQEMASVEIHTSAPAQNTISMGLVKAYNPRQGEIVVGDEDGIWKAKNLDLVIFFQLYFFGIKNESK